MSRYTRFNYELRVYSLFTSFGSPRECTFCYTPIVYDDLDRLDVDFLDLMQRVGVRQMMIGAESGSPRMLKAVKVSLMFAEDKIARELGGTRGDTASRGVLQDRVFALIRILAARYRPVVRLRLEERVFSVRHRVPCLLRRFAVDGEDRQPEAEVSIIVRFEEGASVDLSYILTKGRRWGWPLLMLGLVACGGPRDDFNPPGDDDTSPDDDATDDDDDDDDDDDNTVDCIEIQIGPESPITTLTTRLASEIATAVVVEYDTVAGARGRVRFGPDANYEWATELDHEGHISHHAFLVGVPALTDMHYRVEVEVDGDIYCTEDRVQTTGSLPAELPYLAPSQVGVPPVLTRNHHGFPA